MKKYYIILLLTSLYAILTSCTSHDDVLAEPEDGVYQFDLVNQCCSSEWDAYGQRGDTGRESTV